jgi:hypothetical protein
MNEPIHLPRHSSDEIMPGAVFEHWPVDPPPEVGEKVVIFDRDYDLTQHKVVGREGHRIVIGPATEWEGAS